MHTTFLIRDEKGKGKAFIKLLSGKFSIMYFYQNVQKWSLKKIFIFTPKYQLIRIHIIAESAWVFYKPKNTWKYPYLLQVPFFCLNKVLSFIIIQKMFTIKGSGLNTIGIPTNWWKQILHKVKQQLPSRKLIASLKDVLLKESLYFLLPKDNLYFCWLLVQRAPNLVIPMNFWFPPFKPD